MEEKRGRGRPSVTEKIAGSNAEEGRNEWEKIPSRRSIADAEYALTAAIILTEAASEVEDLELICGEEYQCRSILNQLGRIQRIEGYSKNDIIEIAKETIKSKKAEFNVKEIEKYIRNGRLTDEW